MSEHSREEDSQLQEIETRLQTKFEKMFESKMEGLVESVTSLLQAKLGGLGPGRGESGGASDGAFVGGLTAGGAAEAAPSTGDGGRDAASKNTPTAHGRRPEGVGPALGLLDSGEAIGFYPRGETAAGGLGGGYGRGLDGGLGGPQSGLGLAGSAYGRDALPLPFRITPPQLKGGRNEYPAFREDFLQAAKMVDVYDQFVGSRVRPVPVGETGKSRSVLLAEGFSTEEITASFHAWQFLASALQQAGDRDILRRSISAKDALANLDAWYDPQTQGATQNQFEQFNRFSIAPKDNPIEKLSQLEDLANRLREKGIATDARFLYARFLSALPPEYEHARLTLQSVENLQRNDIIRIVGTQHSYVSQRNGDRPQTQFAFTSTSDSTQQRGRNGEKKGGRNRKSGRRKKGEGGSSEGSGSTSGESNGSERRRCHRCRRVGHIKPDCTTPESEFLDVCTTCEGFGHTPEECPSEIVKVNLAITLDSDPEERNSLAGLCVSAEEVADAYRKLSAEEVAKLARGAAIDVEGF